MISGHMWLTGYVHCRCWQDGLTTRPPPVDPAWILVEDDGELDLSLPYDEDSDEFTAAYEELERWEWDACAHPDRKHASVPVAVWERYLPFHRALAETECTVLLKHLPSDLGYWTDFPASKAETARAELTWFRDATTVTRLPVLVDDDTGSPLWGDEVWSSALARDHEFARGAGTAFCVDEHGFFVRDESASEVFRAARFTQRALPGGHFELDNGEQRLVVPGKPLHSEQGTAPRRVRAEVRPARVVVHAVVIDHLNELLTTAANTGHPVIWSRT
jgi:hypothetical protein